MTSWLVNQTSLFLTQTFSPIWLFLEQVFIMERDVQIIREMSVNYRTPTLTVADGIVNDILSSASSQFRDFTPRDQTSAVNYVRGEPNKYPERIVSPVARNPFRHDNEKNRAPHLLS